MPALPYPRPHSVLLMRCESNFCSWQMALDLVGLGLYDTVIMVDDSASMRFAEEWVLTFATTLLLMQHHGPTLLIEI